MKLNGKNNFITDKDIIITEGNNLGETLSDVLDTQQSDLEKLKSNVKWLYKYGGIGSGGSGSGGSDSSWSLIATLDGSQIADGNTIILTPDLKKYTLKLKVLKGNGVYNVTYKYGTNTYTKTLDQTNNWEYVTTINILSNGKITIEITDNIDTIIREATYVLHAYSISNIEIYKDYKILEDGSLKLINGLVEGSTYLSDASGNTDIYLNEALEKGLCLACSFQRAINAEISYSVTINGEIKKTEIASNDGSTGALFYEIVKKGDVDSWNENSAGVYTVEMEVKIIPNNGEGVTETFTKLFNLIPDNLYLRVTPSSANAVLYDDKVEDPYMFRRGAQSEFILKTYWGSNASRQVIYNFEIEYEDGSIWKMDNPVYTREQVDTRISFIPDKTGWIKLIFSTTLAGATKSVVKYIYSEQIQTSYMWFKRSGEPEDTGVLVSSGAEIVAQEYFRPGYNPTPLFNDIKLIEQTSADSDKTFNLNFSKYNNLRDFTVNIALQYSYINDLSACILSLNYDGNSLIKLYQSYVSIIANGENKDLKIFLPKDENYSAGVTEINGMPKYHMVSIVWTLYNISGLELWYQCTIYVDGVLSGAVPVVLKNTMLFDQLVLHSGNYSVNLIDITYASVPEKTYLNTGVYGAFNDIDLSYYYNTYKSALGIKIPEYETKILESFYTTYVQGYNSSTYNLNNNLVKVTNSIIKTVSENISIPTLMLECDEIIPGENKNVLEWLNAEYKDGTSYAETSWKVPTKLYWSNGLAEIDENRAVSIPYGDNSTFTIAIQGSSTKNQKAKNLTLGISSVTEGTEKVLFSPNFKAEDASTFLPEQEFTLKADIVDSSFSNNTSIGKFINENNSKVNGGWFEYSKSGIDANIRSHVKQCLEGFPVLIFLKIQSTQNVGGVIQTYDDYYYLGVYNFNLGRGSYYNLGYSDLSVFQTKDPNKAGYLGGEDGVFVFTTVSDAEPVNDFIAAEIQDNNKYWDFSQYHPTVLFPLNQNETSNFMFGDIVTNSSTAAYAQDRICNFVEKIAKAGGYLFKHIGKKLVPVGSIDGNALSYHTIGTVPDYRTQYKRISGNTYEIDHTVDNDASIDDLEKCILVPDVNQTQYIPSLNYESASYYYTTCMVFGLVDSVQKNLNIKTWTAPDSITNSPQFGLYFYDMDTSLGIDNAGAETSYFCFSDYWKSSIESTNEVDENGDTIYKNNGVIVYRDYVPEGMNGAYDIPSSYIFAIPKYATLLGGEYKTQYDTRKPQDIYLKWRNLGGVLENADVFIDKYFKSNFENIPNTLLNLNYRNKYLYTTQSEQLPQAVQRLLGTRLEKTRDWFKGRLRILDAYFNINRLQSPICIEDADYQNGLIKESNKTGIDEPKPSDSTSSSNNPDFSISNDIFAATKADGSSESMQRSGKVEFIATSGKYTPMLVFSASSIKRYLFEEENKPYKFLCDFQGTQVSTFGGSSEWRTLNLINDFAKTSTGTTFNLNSDILLDVNSTEMSDWTKSNIDTWNLNVPSAKNIKLNSKYFGGNLTINSSSKFANLVNLDISGSKIGLVLDGRNVKTVRNIKLDNISAELIEINNANDLENVSFNNVKIKEFNISPWFQSDLTIYPTQLIEKLTVIGKDANGTLNISGNDTIKNLNYSKFKNLKIHDCVNLTNVICNDADNDVLETISITNCPKIEQLVLKIDNVTGINLANCSLLSNLTLVGTKFDKLKHLNLSNTLIENITFKSKIEDDGEISDILDLSRFINLSTDKDDANSYFNISENHLVKAIQFTNDANNPVYLKYAFNSRSIQRLYGNIVVIVNGCFSYCTDFSIHGYDVRNIQWMGKNVTIDDVVLMPHQVLGKTIESITDIDLFQSGNRVTNLKVSNAGNNAFSRSACSLFDIYYTLTRGDELFSCYAMFYSMMDKNGINICSFRGKNQPPREMFIKSPNITDLVLAFYNSTDPVVLLSPEHNDAAVLKDNGLFSPLLKLERTERAFGSGAVCFDRFLFRRKTGKYNLKLLGIFHGYHILKDVNNFNFTWNDYSLSNLPSLTEMRDSGWGDLTDFFEDLPYLEDMLAFCRNAYFINYDKLCKVPKKITKLIQCFCAYYGVGTLKLTSIFHDPKLITEIINGPRILSWNTDEWRPYFELNNNTFSEFVNIEKISSSSITSTASGSWNWDEHDTEGNGGSEHPFMRMNKRITGSGFPYDIFKNNTKLKEITGVFSYAAADPGITNISLPGNLLRYTPDLTRCDWLFYNILIPYKLSESKFDKNWEITNNICNFAYCKKLENVERMFGADQLKTDVANKEFTKELPYLTGSIPPRFFFHGGTWITNEITGSNSEINGNYTEETIKHSYYLPNKNITNMRQCFTKNNLSSYKLSSFNARIDEYVESNDEYSPFKYIKQSDGTWINNPKVNTYKNVAYWAYDGDSDNIKDSDNVLYLDSVVKTDCRTYNYETHGTYNYICPPDLFRFCKDFSDLNIKGIFKNSGLNRINPMVFGLPWSSYRAQQFGMTGRICPYLLKPISEVTNVSEMFLACKRLSGYESNEQFFLIPSDFFAYAKNVNVLAGTFAYLLIPAGTNFNDVFLPLKQNTLNINSLFIGSIWGKIGSGFENYLSNVKEKEMIVSNLFNDYGFNFNNITLSFANSDSTTPESGYAYSQSVTFDNIFNSKYSDSIYKSEKYLNNFRAAFKGYNASTVKFSNLNLINDTVTENYQLIGGNIWKTSTTFNLKRPNSNIDNNIEEWTTQGDHESWVKENHSTF